MLPLPSFPGCVSLDSCTWIFSFKFAVSLHQRITASLGTDKHTRAANNAANNTTLTPTRLQASKASQASRRRQQNNPSHHHVAHIHHVRTPVQANLLLVASDQAVLARPEPAAFTSHQHHLGALLLPPVLARREAFYGQRPRRAPDTPDVSIQLALDVPLGSSFNQRPC